MKISICIPTFNRAPELAQLLDSIAAQRGHGLDVEVVISDNASTDGTDALVEQRSAALSIVYRRQPTNVGFDRNLLSAVAIASGEFCWLFGSDDILEAGALRSLEELLLTHPSLGGMSVGSQGYSADLEARRFVRDNVSSQFNADVVLIGRDAVAGAIGPWLGYMSGLIVKSTAWNRVVEEMDVSPFFSGYVHLYVVLAMLGPTTRWLASPRRLVGCRLDNESFGTGDEFARTRLDLVEFERVFRATLGGRSPVFHHVQQMVAGFFIRGHFMNAKRVGVSARYWRQAIPAAFRSYGHYRLFWTTLLPVMATPRPALLFARRLYGALRARRDSH